MKLISVILHVLLVIGEINILLLILYDNSPQLLCDCFNMGLQYTRTAVSLGLLVLLEVHTYYNFYRSVLTVAVS